MPFSIPELLIVLVVLLLIFGAKRLPEMGRSMGRGMREFKDSVTSLDLNETAPTSSPPDLKSVPSEPTSPQRSDAVVEKSERETVS